MWSIQTGSRLHLGLLTLPGESMHRRFGGVGLMIDSPGVVVHAEPATQWIVEGSHHERVSEIIAHLVAGLGPQEPRRVVADAPREHVGLGTGTQLALAVARVLTASWGREIGRASCRERV